MLVRSSLFALICCVPALAQVTAPAPNWQLPAYLDEMPLTANLNNGQLAKPFQSGACASTSPQGVQFQFDLHAADQHNQLPASSTHPPTQGAISTSAVVEDATGSRVATLWNSISIPNGIYCGAWNGHPDTGAAIDTFHAPFTIKLLYNNVQYTWDGVMGVTEADISSASNWDEAGSFPTTMSFLKVPSVDSLDHAYVGTGYNEDHLEAVTFSDPQQPYPMNLALQSGGEFDFSTTDGNRVYFATIGYCCALQDAVVGFTPTGTQPPIGPLTYITNYGEAPWVDPYIFTDVPDILVPRHGQQHYFYNAYAGIDLDNANAPHAVQGVDQLPYFINGVSTAPYTQIAISGLAVERIGNLLAVARGTARQFDCGTVLANTNQIALYDKNTGDPLGSVTLGNNPVTGLPIDPQRMVFDTTGLGNELWIIDGGQLAATCSTKNVLTLGREVTSDNPDPIWERHSYLFRARIIKAGNQYIASVVGPVRLDGPAAPPITGLNPLGLSNPVDVALSSSTGNVFVADGGINQQVYEFKPSALTGTKASEAVVSVISATGDLGGYGQSTANNCNSSMTGDKLWLDAWPIGTGASRPWMSVDDNDGIWVGDFTSSRVLHYTRTSGTDHFALKDAISMGRWLDFLAVPANEPNRVFSGPNGMLEYEVNYPTPDPAVGSAALHQAAFSSTPTHNWLPCFMQAEGRIGAGLADGHVYLRSAETVRYATADGTPTKQTLATVAYHGGPNSFSKWATVNLQSNGEVSLANNRIHNTSLAWLDANGSYYHYSRTDDTYTLQRFDITGADATGLPKWNLTPTVLATINAVPDTGALTPACFFGGCNFQPTKTRGIIPVYVGGRPKFETTFSDQPPVYHLGGFATSSSGIPQNPVWHSQLEFDVQFPTLANAKDRNTASITPENNLGIYSNWGTYAGFQAMGFGAQAVDDFIFTGINGNGYEYGCQFHQYTDDGMLIAQFGWRATGEAAGLVGFAGYPKAMIGQPLAPGACVNPQMFRVVRVGADADGSPNYYMYVGDTSYRAGAQRWHIWNTGSIGRLTGTAALGSQIQLR